MAPNEVKRRGPILDLCWIYSRLLLPWVLRKKNPFEMIKNDTSLGGVSKKMPVFQKTCPKKYAHAQNGYNICWNIWCGKSSSSWYRMANLTFSDAVWISKTTIWKQRLTNLNYVNGYFSIAYFDCISENNFFCLNQQKFTGKNWRYVHDKPKKCHPLSIKIPCLRAIYKKNYRLEPLCLTIVHPPPKKQNKTNKHTHTHTHTCSILHRYFLSLRSVNQKQRKLVLRVSFTWYIIIRSGVIVFASGLLLPCYCTHKLHCTNNM